MKRPSRQPGRTIGARLLTAQAIVSIASIGTAAAVAAIVGPPLFHRHLLEAGHTSKSPELTHIEMAYQEANLVSLVVAVVVALACSLAVSWYLARRIQDPLTNLATAAEDMTQGRYDVRIPATGAGPELDAVTTAFNTMADQLEHTEDTRRRLLSDLGHEMRTPIATTRAYLESIDDGIRDWDDETRQVLHDQIARLTRLASDIAAVSAAEEGRITLQLSTVDINDLLETARHSNHNAYDTAEVQLHLAPSSRTIFVTADPHRIGQVLTNLLDNALRHSSTGQTVTLAAQPRGQTVEVSVEDQGDGIPAEQLTHIFERFYRGDAARHRPGHGSGIGLTISRAIIDAHQGRIHAESDGPGTGTRIVLTLPLA